MGRLDASRERGGGARCDGAGGRDRGARLARRCGRGREPVVAPRPLRRWLARRAAALPAGAALAVAGLALWLASGPAFHARLTSLRMLVGGRAETERLTLA